MSHVPEQRSGPPWIMEEMMAAEPGLATRILDQSQTDVDGVADAVRSAVELGHPVAVVGCGTSEHAAMAVTRLLRAALPGARIASRQAFEATLDPWPDGLCLAISHEGETRATQAALRSAVQAGARTALITASQGSTCAGLADRVAVTPLVDRSWCHTVGYLSPILAGSAIAARLAGWELDGSALGQRLERVLALRDDAAAVARPFASAVTRLVIVGSGLDRIAARELALKIEEGARVPAVGRDLETQLHGHLASADAACGLIAIVIDAGEQAPRAVRARQLLLASRRLSMPTAAIVTPDVDASWPADLTSAGRLVLPARTKHSDRALPAQMLALTDGALALQVLTLALVHAVHTNPDLIRREDLAYREAAALADPHNG